MGILRVRKTKILNFKTSRSLLSALFMRAARALLRHSSIELGVLACSTAKIAEFSDLGLISTILEHGFYVRAS
jgi:hypothetical protein